MPGWVIWEGPSPVTGAAIGVLVTDGSRNTKTGPMLQAWVLVRDVAPQAALRSGADEAICGDCVHRAGLDGHGRTCYVSLFTGPSGVWRAWSAGKYPRLTAAEAATLVRGQAIRVTAYGDPAMAPVSLWAGLLADAGGWTGYTHRWRACDPRFAAYLMASVESDAEAALAQRLGWRTFRARSVSSPLAAGEVVCPASEEAGHRTTCARCQLCRGTATTAKSIAIVLHGKTATRVSGRPAAHIPQYTAPIRAALERGEAVLLEGDRRRQASVLRTLSMFYRRRQLDRPIASARRSPSTFALWFRALRGRP